MIKISCYILATKSMSNVSLMQSTYVKRYFSAKWMENNIVPSQFPGFFGTYIGKSNFTCILIDLKVFSVALKQYPQKFDLFVEMFRCFYRVDDFFGRLVFKISLKIEDNFIKNIETRELKHKMISKQISESLHKCFLY